MIEPRSGMPAIWSDGLGRASIRSVQVLAVSALAWAIIWAASRIPLVIIPVLIAVILAAAISPLVRWLTGHALAARPRGGCLVRGHSRRLRQRHRRHRHSGLQPVGRAHGPRR